MEKGNSQRIKRWIKGVIYGVGTTPKERRGRKYKRRFLFNDAIEISLSRSGQIIRNAKY